MNWKNRPVLLACKLEIKGHINVDSNMKYSLRDCVEFSN